MPSFSSSRRSPSRSSITRRYWFWVSCSKMTRSPSSSAAFTVPTGIASTDAPPQPAPPGSASRAPQRPTSARAARRR